MILADSLRSSFEQLRIQVNCGGGSFKSQMKKADKSGAELALILGENEVDNQSVSVKYLRSDEGQLLLAQEELLSKLPELLKK